MSQTDGLRLNQRIVTTRTTLAKADKRDPLNNMEAPKPYERLHEGCNVRNSELCVQGRFNTVQPAMGDCFAPCTLH